MTKVGVLEIDLKGNYQAAINGLSKAEFHFEKVTRSYMKLEENINKGVSKLFQASSSITNISESIKAKLESLENQGFNIDASGALSTLQKINENVFEVVDGVGSASAVFGTFSTKASRGIIAVAKKVPLIGSRMVALAGPIGLVVGGIAGLATFTIKNFDLVVKGITKVINFFRKLYNENTRLRIGVESIKFAFQTVFNVAKGFFDFLKVGFFTVGKLLDAVFSGDFENIGSIIKEGFEQAAKVGEGFIETTKKNFKDAALNVLVNTELQPVEESDVKKYILDKVKSVTDLIGFKLPTELGLPSSENIEKTRKYIVREFETAKPLALPSTIEFKSLGEQAFENVGVAIDKITQKYSLLGDAKASLSEQIGVVENSLMSLGEQGISGNSIHVAQLLSLLQSLQGQYDSLNTEKAKEGFKSVEESMKEGILTAEQFESAFSSSVENAMGSMIDSLINGANVGQTALKGIFGFLGDLLIKVGELAIKVGGVMSAVKTALNFGNPFAAFAAGGLAIATGKLFKSYAAPKLAKGGLAYGETLATVGDNPNSQIDPEVISPLSKLKALIANEMGSSKLEVSLSGGINHRQLLLSTEYGGYYKSLVQ